jgi:hypothetical protein
VSDERPTFHIDAADADWIKRGRQQRNLIQQSLALGVPDDVIVHRIMEETAVTEVDAWLILAREKGEDVDDVR